MMMFMPVLVFASRFSRRLSPMQHDAAPDARLIEALRRRAAAATRAALCAVCHDVATTL